MVRNAQRTPARLWRLLGLILVGVALAGCTDDYAELRLSEALAEAAARGQETDIAWVPSDDVRPGTVLEGVSRPDGTVRLRVSSGGLVPVPQLVNLTEADATTAVEELGLKVRRRTETERQGPFGAVTRSEPALDTLVEPGATVTLFVREEQRNEITGTLVLVAGKDQLGGETLPTDGGEDSEDWSDRGPSFAGERCWGSGFYSDLVDGAQFIVRNAGGTIVAKGELGRGRTVYVGEPDAKLLRDVEWECHFSFAIDGVPFSEFYAIETVRNTLTYSFDELEALRWSVDLTIPVDGPADRR